MASPVLACPAGDRAMGKTELLFGLSRRGRSSISEAQWRAFLDHDVTPRFPDGLTIFAGLGQWRSANGRVTRESMRMLVIWHAPGDDASQRIDAIRGAYKRRFRQESVMRVDEASCVSY